MPAPRGRSQLRCSAPPQLAAPDSPDKTVLIIDANPFMIGSEFHPDAIYSIHIDNDGDVEADVVFGFVFCVSTAPASTVHRAPQRLG